MSSYYTAAVFIVPLIPLLIWAYIKYWDSVYSTWKKRGIPNLPGTFPYGSNKEFTRETEFAGYLIEKMYNHFPKQPYFGFFQGSIPFLMLRNPEIVRLVLAKEFSHFRDRAGQKMRDDDYLSHHLFNLEGEKWRALRVKMTPVFTSGKLKAMFEHFLKCTEALSDLLLLNTASEIDVKDIVGRLSTDIICSCAFGLEVNSIKGNDSPFTAMGKEFAKLRLRPFFKFKIMLMRYFPFFRTKKLPRVIPKSFETAMVKIVKDTIEHREKTGEKRQDFIDLLMEIQKKGVLNEGPAEGNNTEPIVLTFELMTAQCFVFFIAGFETSSSVQTFCLYELAFNQDIQERLHIEIETTIKKHGAITYKAVQEMEYLDMVVNETMRKYPTVTMLLRRCTLPFTTPYGHVIEEGDRIMIPLWALHHDPQLFPHPDKFNPERFSPENKESIHPFAFMPFGEGPRMCIGSRFGLLQTKMGIITIVRHFVVSPCGRTTRQIEFDPKAPILTRTKGEIILKITARDNAHTQEWIGNRVT